LFFFRKIFIPICTNYNMGIEAKLNMKVIDQGLKRFRRDIKYFERNYRTLREEYLDQFIAIYNEEVVAHRATIKELINELDEEQLDPTKVYVGNTYPQRQFILDITA